MSTLLPFIISSVLIVLVIWLVINDATKTIKILESGSTLEKMRVLCIGVSITMSRKGMGHLIKEKRKETLISKWLGIGLIIIVVSLTLFRMIENYLGI